jgi:hypothetical protein
MAAMRRALEAAEACPPRLDWRVRGDALRLLIAAANAERADDPPIGVLCGVRGKMLTRNEEE